MQEKSTQSTASSEENKQNFDKESHSNQILSLLTIKINPSISIQFQSHTKSPLSPKYPIPKTQNHHHHHQEEEEEEEERNTQYPKPKIIRRRRRRNEIPNTQNPKSSGGGGGGGGTMIGGDMNDLPDECLSHVISYTSSRDACAAAAVSAALKSAADSDATWEHFLPPDCFAILSRAVSPVRYGSKKELFFRLCDDPVLIDGGKMSFGLERQSGAKCFMIAAKALWIVWSQDERYWNWVSLSNSRFKESAKLLEACWLEIQGKIPSDLLSPHTSYSTFLIFKLADNARGLGSPPQETSVTLGGEPVSKNSVCLQPDEGGRTVRNPWDPFGFRFPRYMGLEEVRSENVKLPRRWKREKEGGEEREGWMEIEMGEVWNEKGEGGEVEMSLMEITGGHWKRGLIVHGIEIRPKG